MNKKNNSVVKLFAAISGIAAIAAVFYVIHKSNNIPSSEIEISELILTEINSMSEDQFTKKFMQSMPKNSLVASDKGQRIFLYTADLAWIKPIEADCKTEENQLPLSKHLNMMCAFTFIAKTKSAKYLTLQTAWGAYAPDESTKFNFGVSPEIKIHSDKSKLLPLIDQARKLNKNRFKYNTDLIFNELIAANKENQFK